MRTCVHSGQLRFTRDGKTLVVAERDGVTFVEPRADGRRRTPIDVAIDPDGKLLAIRLAGGELELAPARERAATRQPAALPEPGPGDAELTSRRPQGNRPSSPDREDRT